MCVCQMVCFVKQKRTPVEMCPLCYKINLFCYLHHLLPDVIGVVSRLFRLLRFYLGHKIFKRTMGAIPMQQTRKKNTKKTNIHTRVYIYPTDVSTVAHFALLSHSAHQPPSTSFPQFNVSRRSQMLFVGASVPRCAVDLSAHGCMCACTININCWLVYTRQSCNCINEPSKHNWSTYVQRISVWINILISIQIL